MRLLDFLAGRFLWYYHNNNLSGTHLYIWKLVALTNTLKYENFWPLHYIIILLTWLRLVHTKKRPNRRYQSRETNAHHKEHIYIYMRTSKHLINYFFAAKNLWRRPNKNLKKNIRHDFLTKTRSAHRIVRYMCVRAHTHTHTPRSFTALYLEYTLQSYMVVMLLDLLCTVNCCWKSCVVVFRYGSLARPAHKVTKHQTSKENPSVMWK